jgi:hypothetical protein
MDQFDPFKSAECHLKKFAVMPKQLDEHEATRSLALPALIARPLPNQYECIPELFYSRKCATNI